MEGTSHSRLVVLPVAGLAPRITQKHVLLISGCPQLASARVYPGAPILGVEKWLTAQSIDRVGEYPHSPYGILSTAS